MRVSTNIRPYVRLALRGSAGCFASLGMVIATPGVAQEEGTVVEELAEISITGSRIVRRDLEAASPILTVDASAFEDTSQVGLEAALNKLPQFQPGRSQFTGGAGEVQASAINSPGTATVDLRGIGSNRTLVLVDGRRAQPVNATLVVDINSIPTSAISNVEVISGGASSVYGADAIAGVVNFKLKNDFEGFDLNARAGVTEEGDGSEALVSALLGANLADGRGNVMFGAEMARRQAVAQRDRRFYTDAWSDPGTQIGSNIALYRYGGFVPAATNLPSQAAVDAVFGTGGISRSSIFFINPDGSVFKNSPIAGNPAASSVGYTGPMEGVKINPDGTLSEPEGNQNISSPLERYSLFGRGTFNVSDNLSVFVQANLSSVEVQSIAGVAQASAANFNIPIPRDADHPVSPELAMLLDSRPNPNAAFQVDRLLDFMGPRHAENQSTAYQVMFGLQGVLPVRDWTWEAYASHGESRNLNYLRSGFASRDRLRRIAAAPNYGRNLSLTAPGSYQITCTTGLPIMEYFTPSQDCIDAIQVRMRHYTNITQDIVELNAQGGIVDLPTGELRGALGISTRRNSAVFDPDPMNDSESILDAPIGVFASANTSGEVRVNEVYGELLVPVLSGLPMVKDLSLELGGRYSDYNTAGGSWTYKGLVNWRMNNFIGIRGGYQMANRAPNIAELYLGVTQQPITFPESDPCANTTRAAYGNVPGNPDRAQVQALCSTIIGSGTSTFDLDPSGFAGTNGGYFPVERESRAGNVNLKPEKAETFTLGAVLHSPFELPSLSRMTASIDYYRIKIEDTIAPLGASTIWPLCLNANGVSNPGYSIDDPGGYCRLIHRDPVTGGRQSVDALYANLGLTQTSGIDLALNWRSDLADIGLQRIPGELAVNLAFNYLLEFDTQVSSLAPILDIKGTLEGGGQYDHRIFSSVAYSYGDWRVSLDWQHLPSIRSAAYVQNPDTDIRGARSYDLFDLKGGWDLSSTTTLRFGVDNLFNSQPEVTGYIPGVTNARGSTATGYYDELGRRYYVGVNFRF